MLQFQYARDWLLDNWYVYRAGLVVVMSTLVIVAEGAVAAPYKTGVITALTAGGGTELMRDILGREYDRRRIAAARNEVDRETWRRDRAERRADRAERRADRAERRADRAERRAEEDARREAEAVLRAAEAERRDAEAMLRAAEAERRAAEAMLQSAVEERRVAELERENAELRRRLERQQNGGE